MAGKYQVGSKTTTQQLIDHVAFYLQDREVELQFRPNKQNKGRIAPEFDFIYLIEGRRITERGLAFRVTSFCHEQNLHPTTGAVIACLTELAFRAYCENQEYPEWMQVNNARVPEVKRPKGRPRKHPKELKRPRADKSINKEINESEESDND